MLRYLKVGPLTATLFLMGACAEAGSIHLHQDRAEIEDAADLRFYERQVQLRDWAPAKYDRVHPLGGRLLSEESVYEKLLAEWEAHPARFDHDHPCLWHTLHGDFLYHELHPVILPSLPTGIPPVHDEIAPPIGGGGPPVPPGGGPNPPFHPSAVPEPATGVLMLSGLILVGVAVARRRVHERLKPHRSVRG
jgi:hypothetical protein